MECLRESAKRDRPEGMCSAGVRGKAVLKPREIITAKGCAMSRRPSGDISGASRVRLFGCVSNPSCTVQGMPPENVME